MSNIYDMSGKKKVIFIEEPKINITYREIMSTIIKYATEEACHQIFCDGGITLCPSEVLGNIIDKKKEENDCNDENIGCTKCWSNAINLLKGADNIE